MLVQIRDGAALSSISIVSLRAYLNSREWTDAGMWGESSITIFAREHNGRTWEILVPHRDTIAGYAENMAETVAVLAEVEGRSQLEVFYDLSAASCDVVRLHSLNGVAKEPLSLRRSADLLQDSYGMLGYAARSVDDPRAAYRGGPNAKVAEYLDNVRPVPGYAEGYSLTLHSAIPAGIGAREDFGKNGQLPFARRVTNRLAQALEYAENAVPETTGLGLSVTNANIDLEYAENAVPETTRHAPLAPFVGAENHGVSANLCDSVAALAKKGNGIEISIIWASVRPANVQTARFPFSKTSAEILDEAAKFLRTNEPSYDERVIAQVVRLERGPDRFDGRADILASRDGQSTRIKVEFPKSYYDMAIEAFRDNRRISLTGDIYKIGNRYELRHPRDLVIV